ncbi:MAG: hypothetical protein SynsKO_43730 [Synoicihabitans sp.]
MRKCFTFVSLIFGVAGVCWGETTPEVDRTVEPDWVMVRGSFDRDAPVDDQTPDVEYLLFDRQVDVDLEQTYTHVVVRVTREGGLQSAGEWSVTFDPLHQTVAIHRIRIHRNGDVLDRLESSEFRYLEKEENSDWHIYDGDVTAMTLLEDVRIGDVVEFSYTRTGRNPVFGGTYFDSFSLGWGTPVRSMRAAMSATDGREISRAGFGPTIVEPETVVEDGRTTWVWSLENTPVLPYEDATPSWYSTRPWVQVSEYQEWADVVDWALPLYAAGDEQPVAELLAETADLPDPVGAASDEDEKRVVQLLAYVQREIRYLGIELGESSHQPHDPVETYTRRFGDCKDKTLLLVQLLRSEGWEAYPVLVNSLAGEKLDARLPSPGVFDHVIVGLKLDAGWRWLDPTMTPRPGSLAARAAPDYGFGLMIKAGETSLRRIEQPTEARSTTDVKEEFVVGARDELSLLNVETEYRGGIATRVRSRLENTSSVQIRQDYQEYYAYYFPQVEIDSDVAWDAADDGSLRVRERYVIEGIWVRDEEENVWEMEVYGGIVGDELPTGVGVERTAPRAISHPVKVSQTQTLRFSDDWDVSLPDEIVDNPWFRYSRKVNQVSPQELVITLSYESKASYVEASDMGRYVEDLLVARDSLGIELSQWDEVDGFGVAAGGEELSFQPNYLMFVVALLSLAGGVVVLRWWVKRYHRHVPPAPPTSSGEDTPSLGGWLILPLLGTLIAPFRLMADLWLNFRDAFDQSVWIALTSPGSEAYNSALALLIIVEVGVNMFMVVLVIANLVFFLRRDRCLPRLYQFILIFSFVFILGDLIAGNMIQVFTEEDNIEVFAELFKMILGIAIWVPYFSVSKRVKRTFVR